MRIDGIYFRPEQVKLLEEKVLRLKEKVVEVEEGIAVVSPTAIDEIFGEELSKDEPAFKQIEGISYPNPDRVQSKEGTGRKK